MQVALFVTLGIIGAYAIFVVFPAFVGCMLLFRRIDWCVPLKENPAPKQYYLPYMDEIIGGIDFFEKIGAEDVKIQTRDNIFLCGQFYNAKSNKTVIMAHGFMTTAMESFAISGRAFFEKGINVLIIDERAHGKSGGKRTTMGLYESEDLLGWADWVADYVPSGEIYLYGVSMGGFAVALTAGMKKTPQIKALIVDSAYVSVKDQLIREYTRRKLPAALLIVWSRVWARIVLKRDIYYSAEKSLASSDVPVLFIHGTADKTVDVKNQTLLYEACTSKKEMFTVPEAEHTMPFATGGLDLQNKIFLFIEGVEK